MILDMSQAVKCLQEYRRNMMIGPTITVSIDDVLTSIKMVTDNHKSDSQYIFMQDQYNRMKKEYTKIDREFEEIKSVNSKLETKAIQQNKIINVLLEKIENMQVTIDELEEDN